MSHQHIIGYSRRSHY